MDESLLGKCGYYCGQCPSFLSGACAGCVKGNEAGACYSRDCALEKGILSCGHCRDFPCSRIQEDPKATLLNSLWLKWKAVQKDTQVPADRIDHFSVPPQTESLLRDFVEQSKSILRDDLVGVYLHGSAVMGCFNPEKSDVDLIVVVGRPLSDPVKRAYMDMVVRSSALGPAKGIEMSVVLKEVCRPFVYPTPYELHFSEAHLERCPKDPDRYIREMRGTDRDLAAHFTILTKRGRCLYGAPIREVFAEVPARDYMDSLWYDIEGAAEEITEYPMYLTLNLARVLAYQEEGLVLSKKEGGEWALRRLPAEFRPLIRSALREYSESADVVYEEGPAKRYAEFALSRIRQKNDPERGDKNGL